MDKIKCPHCGKQVELSEAIIHQLSKTQVEKARAEEREKTEREQKEKALLATRQKDKELEEMRRKIAKKEQEDKEREEKIREQAKKDAEEQQALKIKEKDIQVEQIKKVAEELRRANEDLKRKLDQGSQQMQGEVLEVELEEKLRSAFEYDEFLPVPKGIRGADVIQHVRNKYEKIASIIIWESKRTKAWDKKWLSTLRENARRVEASEAVIVSEVLPDEIKVYGKIDGVWVTSRQYVIPLATILREMGLRIAIAKSGAKHDDINLKKIHDYILSERFRHRIEKDVETVSKSLEMLEKKHNVDEKFYRLQKSSLEAMRDNTSQIYFDLQEILPALPPIAGIEGELIEGDNNDDQTLF